MDSIYLNGADDVRAGGNSIRQGGEDIRSAASTISEACRQFAQAANNLSMSLDRHREVIESFDDTPEPQPAPDPGPDKLGQLIGFSLLMVVGIGYAITRWIAW